MMTEETFEMIGLGIFLAQISRNEGDISLQ
jgi:hypothetical protein